MLNSIYVDNIIKTALLEDINYTDITTEYLIPEESENIARFISRDEGILCGIDIALRVFKILQNDIQITKYKRDGDKISKGDIIAEIKGKTHFILEGERTALNFMQHMSGIATATNRAVELTRGTNVTITDTRKTIPGLRPLQKYAIKIGGGKNHRFNLSDIAMIKDNHSDAAGGIINSVIELRKKIGNITKIAVEVRNLDEFEQALSVKTDIIILRNMSPENIKQAVEIANGTAIIEAYGNINFDNIREIAETGVNFIGMGVLTDSVNAFDISLKIFG